MTMRDECIEYGEVVDVYGTLGSQQKFGIR